MNSERGRSVKSRERDGEIMSFCDSYLLNRTGWGNGTLLDNVDPSGGDLGSCTLHLAHSALCTFTLYALLLLALCRKCCPSKPIPLRTAGPLAPTPKTLFLHHVPYWNITGILALALMTKLAESLLLWTYTGAGSSYLGIGGGALGLLALLAQGAFFHVTEARGDKFWLLALVFFHGVTGTLSGCQLGIYFGDGLRLDHVKVGVELVGAICSIALIPLLIHSLIRHTVGKGGRSEGVPNVVYVHQESSLASRLSFYWFTALLRIGYTTPLEEHHLGNLPTNETTQFQFNRFHKFYKQYNGRLWRSMWGTVWSSMLLGGLFRLGADFAGFVAPLGIKTIVSYTEGNWTLPTGTTGLTVYQFMGNGYVMALVVLLSSLLQATFSQSSTFLVNSEGIHIKVALQALIYEKGLRLGAGRGKEEEEDESSLDNILSEDTNNLMMFFWMAHFIWAIPLKLGILMGLLYLQLGYSALIGAAICILIMIPLQFLIAKNMSSNSKQLMERCDERLRGMNEILQGIKLLKLHGWELLFGNQVRGIRDKELRNLDRDLLYRSIMTFMTHISSVLVTLVTFGLYPLIESDRLEPPKVFAGLALFNQLTVPLFIFPITVPVVIDALVSGKRVSEFLSLPEAEALPSGGDEGEEGGGGGIPLNPITSDPEGSTDSVFLLENIAEEEEEGEGEGAEAESSPLVLSLSKASFCWEGDQVLSNISLLLPKGKLTVVVGPTGSGKSSLVSAILGEMPKSTGEVHWSTGIRIAYAAQTPWMLNANVRDNILFGRGFKGARYKRVIQACALQPDIDILPENDQTEIGDKGINLSGGQKQRIAIARALYSNANFVILDDPLSALDVDVAHHVLNIGIRKFLMQSGRTVLLVTHHHLALHHAQHIVAMEKGEIRIQGTLKEIEAGDPELHGQWHDLMKKKDLELQRQLETKTAKERWTLLKLVSKVGLQFRSKGKTEIEPFRSRKSTFSHYKNLSHDIFLPSDSCHEEIFTPLLRRRPISRTSRDSRASGSWSSKHRKVERMSSLQGERKTKSPSVAKKFLRLQSLPVDEDLPSQRNTLQPPQEVNKSQADSLIKRLFSTKNTLSSTGSSNTELDKETVGLRSTASGLSEGDITEDDCDDAEEWLVRGEGRGEEREYGTVPLRIYLIYIGACGRVLSGSYLLFALGYEVIRVYTNFWLSEWSDQVSLQGQDEEAYDRVMSYYFKVYVLLSLLTVAVSLVCNLLGKQGGANSRQLLHAKMMDRLIRCPVAFFDSTPVGRIINRFSSDVAVVDRKLCISMQRFLQFVFLCLSAIVVNAIVNPWFLLVALPVVAIYYFIQRFYRFSSRELQRIQAISRGPIYSHFHETLEGLSTIRAFRQQRRFTQQMLYKIDMNNRADMFINVGNRWLSISLDYLGSVIVFLATLGSMLSAELYPSVVTPSIVGLAINYTLLVPVYLNWVVKFLAEVEMFMNSVDRLERYSELEVEDYEGEPSALPPGWPSAGKIEFRNVTVQYGPDRPPIISNLNLIVPPKQKVGICGRSGSGKSSLLMSLFRVSGLSSGQILIDGVDISKIPLLRLRSALSIIPQENILFSGTLRFNLDPEGRVTDAQIWNALELAQMKRTVQETPGQLDAEMREGAGGFSVGQKQLLALARAILHKSKVVIMDEATSSVDLATELTLLNVVKEEFKGSTVLTIAHRLETIADGDRVVVLEGGALAEDGQPAKLMRIPRSQFATMIRTSQQQARLST